MPLAPGEDLFLAPFPHICWRDRLLFRLEISDLRLVARQVEHFWMRVVLLDVIDLVVLRLEVVDEVRALRVVQMPQRRFCKTLLLDVH